MTEGLTGSGSCLLAPLLVGRALTAAVLPNGNRQPWAQAQAPDVAAHAEADKLLRVSRRYLSSEADARAAMQEAFLNI